MDVQNGAGSLASYRAKDLTGQEAWQAGAKVAVGASQGPGRSRWPGRCGWPGSLEVLDRLGTPWAPSPTAKFSIDILISFNIF